MLTQQTIETLRLMRLSGMIEAYRSQAEEPNVSALSFDERFGLIVDREWARRQSARLTRMIRDARFRVPACMEDIDYTHPRGLDRKVMASLGTCEWVRHKHNCLISGPTGSGKTYIACALGNAACRAGLATGYYRVPKLLGELNAARGEGSHSGLMSHVSKLDLLILDDWGGVPLTSLETREILDIIDERAGTRSTVVVSQLPIEQWYSSIPDSTMADAILDRLVHNAYKIVLKGESMRKLTAKPLN